MDTQKSLHQYLDPLPLGGWQFHREVGSTNDLAMAWARRGAPDWALVLADAQTAGRGREDRRWITRPGTALAMSLALRPTSVEMRHVSRFAALAALGLVKALALRGLLARVKWPNDVLLAGRKTAGVLVEALWQGDSLDALVVGMGVNVHPGSVPPPETLRFPGTAVECVLGRPVDRWHLLADILKEMRTLREDLPRPSFVVAWNTHLAFRGAWVRLREPQGGVSRARVAGVLADGRLALTGPDEEVRCVSAGEIEIAYNKDRKA